MFIRAGKRFDTLEKRTGRLEEKVSALNVKTDTVHDGIKYLIEKSDKAPKPITWPMFLGILTLLFTAIFGVIKVLPVIAAMISK